MPYKNRQKQLDYMREYMKRQREELERLRKAMEKLQKESMIDLRKFGIEPSRHKRRKR